MTISQSFPFSHDLDTIVEVRTRGDRRICQTRVKNGDKGAHKGGAERTRGNSRGFEGAGCLEGRK